MNKRTSASHINPNIMPTLTPLPDRETFEREIHDLFRNGDLGTIARYLERGQSIVSKQFNPFTDEKHNIVFEFLKVLWAMDGTREGLADATLCAVIREREKWLGEMVIPIESDARLTKNILTEIGEFVEAELSGETWDEKIAECVDIEVAANKKKAALIAQRNRAHFGLNGNGKR